MLMIATEVWPPSLETAMSQFLRFITVLLMLSSLPLLLISTNGISRYVRRAYHRFSVYETASSSLPLCRGVSFIPSSQSLSSKFWGLAIRRRRSSRSAAESVAATRSMSNRLFHTHWKFCGLRLGLLDVLEVARDVRAARRCGSTTSDNFIVFVSAISLQNTLEAGENFL